MFVSEIYIQWKVYPFRLQYFSELSTFFVVNTRDFQVICWLWFILSNLCCWLRETDLYLIYTMVLKYFIVQGLGENIFWFKLLSCYVSRVIAKQRALKVRHSDPLSLIIYIHYFHLNLFGHLYCGFLLG